jgi:hypothetical protein
MDANAALVRIIMHVAAEVIPALQHRDIEAIVGQRPGDRGACRSEPTIR